MTENSKDCFVSSDPDLIDFEFVYHSLTKETYWGKNFTPEEFKRATQNSLLFGLYSSSKKQIGFSRVITDYLTLAYITDTFIKKDHRNQGLGRFMAQEILDDERFKDVRRWLLVTEDVHDFYKQHGFQQLENPEKHLEKKSLTKIF